MSPVRKHEPVPEKQMNYISHRDTICAILRDIYFATQNPEIKLKARIATSMAKSMSRKLMEYKSDWDNDIFYNASKNDITNRKMIIRASMAKEQQ
jgi:hypothetical protein